MFAKWTGERFVKWTGARFSKIVNVVLLVAVGYLGWTVVAFAQTITLANKELASLVSSGEALSATTHYYRLVAGSDGTNLQPLLVDASGNLQVDVLTSASEDFTLGDNASDPSPVQPVGAVLMGWDGTSYDRVRLQAAGHFGATIVNGSGTGADIAVPADNMAVAWTLGVHSALLGYESVGGVWDRLHMDTSGNLYTTLATALDSSIDSISIAVNDVIPQMDSTDRLAVSLYGQDAAAGDSVLHVLPDNSAFADGTTTLIGAGFIYDDVAGTALTENDTAAARIDSKRAAVGVIESAATRGLAAEVLTTTADNTVATTNSLVVSNFNHALDAAGAYDPVRLSHTTGFFALGDADCDDFTVTGTAGCTAADYGAVGSFYTIQSNGRVYCRAEADATTPAVTTSSHPVESPGIYPWTPASTSADTVCCLSDGASLTIHVCPVTFP